MSPALVNGGVGGGGVGGTSGGFVLTQRRGPIAAEFQGPGPAAVALPSTIGKKERLSYIILFPYSVLCMCYVVVEDLAARHLVFFPSYF